VKQSWIELRSRDKPFEESADPPLSWYCLPLFLLTFTPAVPSTTTAIAIVTSPRDIPFV
jgi:hypothetical protein